jgi:hypothetical protein
VGTISSFAYLFVALSDLTVALHHLNTQLSILTANLHRL